MKALERLERCLYQRGFTHPQVRELVRNQLALTALALVAGAALSWLSLAPLHFAAGAVLISFNFYSLAKFVQHVVYVKKGAVPGLLARFYGRLIVTGLALYALIVWAEVSVVALLAGLSSVVAIMLLWGATYFFGQNVKEA